MGVAFIGHIGVNYPDASKKYKIDLTPQPPSLVGKGERNVNEILQRIVPSYLLEEKKSQEQKNHLLYESKIQIYSSIKLSVPDWIYTGQ